MRIPNSKLIWLAVTVASVALVIASFVLTVKLNLHPCHLCILQRVLFMLLAGFALLAALFSPGLTGRLIGVIVLATAATGIGVAGYQVWLQSQPLDPFSCTSGTPELVEHIVDWLGRKSPDMFMATGLCQDVELTILKLSMAGWALVAYSAAFIAAVVAILTKPRR
jgi:disulfide bond formation protein DsbB